MRLLLRLSPVQSLTAEFRATRCACKVEPLTNALWKDNASGIVPQPSSVLMRTVFTSVCKDNRLLSYFVLRPVNVLPTSVRAEYLALLRLCRSIKKRPAEWSMGMIAALCCQMASSRRWGTSSSASAVANRTGRCPRCLGSSIAHGRFLAERIPFPVPSCPRFLAGRVTKLLERNLLPYLLDNADPYHGPDLPWPALSQDAASTM